MGWLPARVAAVKIALHDRHDQSPSEFSHVAGCFSSDGGNLEQHAIFCQSSRTTFPALDQPVVRSAGCGVLYNCSIAKPAGTRAASRQSCRLDAEYLVSSPARLLNPRFLCRPQASFSERRASGRSKGPGLHASRYKRPSRYTRKIALFSSARHRGTAQSSAADFLSRLLVTILQPRVTRCGKATIRFHQRWCAPRRHQRGSAAGFIESKQKSRIHLHDPLRS